MDDEAGALPQRSRVRGRCAFVAAVSAALTVAGGCSPAIKLPARYVRMEQLLAQDPAWRQVAGVDGAARSDLPAPPVAASSVEISMGLLPTTFVAPPAVPTALTQERTRRVSEEAHRYVDEVIAGLKRRNEQLLRRAARVAAVRTKALTGAESARLYADVVAERRLQARDLTRQITGLQYRDADLQEQIRADIYPGRARPDAVGQDAIVRGMTDSLTARRQALLTSDIQPEVAVRLAPYRARIEAASRARLQQLSDQLARQLAERSSSEEANIARAEVPIRPIGAGPLPPARPASTPPHLLPSITAPPLAALAAAQTNSAAAAARSAPTLSEREQMLAFVYRDLTQAVQAIALQQGWRLVPEGTPGAQDDTRGVAETLRAAWKPAS